MGNKKRANGIKIVERVTRLQADRRKRKITAYDRMIKFDADVSDFKITYDILIHGRG